MPRGASPKREREYEELKQEFHKEHRYPGREKEVAAQIVNKQRKMYGETKGQKKQEKKGDSPDRNLPIDRYQHLTVPEIKRKISGMSKRELTKIRNYERSHKNRKGLMEALDRAA